MASPSRIAAVPALNVRCEVGCGITTPLAVRYGNAGGKFAIISLPSPAFRKPSIAPGGGGKFHVCPPPPADEQVNEWLAILERLHSSETTPANPSSSSSLVGSIHPHPIQNGINTFRVIHLVLDCMKFSSGGATHASRASRGVAKTMKKMIPTMEDVYSRMAREVWRGG